MAIQTTKLKAKCADCGHTATYQASRSGANLTLSKDGLTQTVKPTQLAVEETGPGQSKFHQVESGDLIEKRYCENCGSDNLVES